MNININAFIPSFREASLKKIYKDFPGWQEELLPVEHVIDFYGNPTTLSITRHPRISTNCFDGIGVIRCDLDGDVRNTGKYPFLAFNWEEVVRKWLGTTTVKENAEAKIKYAVHFPPRVITGKDEYREIGIWANMATYLANQPIDATKDNSENRRKRLMEHLDKEMKKMSEDIAKNIVTRQYKKEAK